MEKPIIEARNLKLSIPVLSSKDRRMLTNPARFLVDLYFSRTTRGIATLLDDISFDLYRGDRLGIIGPNGAGKSTLLRVLAGIYQLTAGDLKVNGTAKGLFDISLGMNHDATGLENIYLRGLQMNLPMKQVKKLVPEVVAFAELGDALDKPFNTYSTGMRLRLAFSISTMIDPDILLLDEWIGTGDAYFKNKVAKRMDTLVQQSNALVLATHSVGLMKDLCTHGLVLGKGKMNFYGEIDDALAFYNEQTN